MAREAVNKNDDYYLWERFKKGERSALSQIYYQNYPALYNYGLRLSSDSALIKDTIQELFFDLLSRLTRLGPTDNIAVYLWTVFRRRIIHKLKQARNYSYWDHEDPVFHVEVAESPEDTIIGREQEDAVSGRLRDILDELPPREREAIYLKYYQNMGYKEISQVMGVKYSSVGKLIYRAMTTLREHGKVGLKGADEQLY